MVHVIYWGHEIHLADWKQMVHEIYWAHKKHLADGKRMENLIHLVCETQSVRVTHLGHVTH